MQRPGFYFPFIHIRNDNWLKAAALYWPSVRRLVPHGYTKHDSPTAKSFFDARILQDEDPAELVDATTWNLLTALKENAELLVKRYGVKRAEKDFHGEVWGEGKRRRPDSRARLDPHYEIPARSSQLLGGLRARHARTIRRTLGSPTTGRSLGWPSPGARRSIYDGAC